MTTRKLDNKLVKDQVRDQQLVLLTISQVQPLVLLRALALHTPLQAVLKLLSPSELDQQVQALPTQQAHQATNPRDQQAAQASHLRLVDPLATHQDHRLHTQALKAHTQAPEPLFP
jgi:hypothetical protein